MSVDNTSRVYASFHHSSEGIPAYFDNLTRLLGGKQMYTDHLSLDTGDIVEDARGRR